MRLQIDRFYRDSKVGHLKFKGWLDGNLLFDNYVNAYGKMNVERFTLQPTQKKRLARLKPCLPPQ